MNVDNLVTMANQIGEFFDAMPERDEALEGISNHIRKFWAPRMRDQLTAYWSVDGGTALSPIVLEALKQHSIQSAPMPANPRDPMKGSGRHDFDGATEA